ncbi:MAG TPA: hypothetical protein VD860_08705 [Azospirillum sp.]|nr:hypothetical protein [Azospirillum sp.]
MPASRIHDTATMAQTSSTNAAIIRPVTLAAALDSRAAAPVRTTCPSSSP